MLIILHFVDIKEIPCAINTAVRIFWMNIFSFHLKKYQFVGGLLILHFVDRKESPCDINTTVGVFWVDICCSFALKKCQFVGLGKCIQMLTIVHKTILDFVSIFLDAHINLLMYTIGVYGPVVHSTSSWFPMLCRNTVL